MNGMLRRLVIIGLVLVSSLYASSQRYLSDLDSSLFIKDTLKPFLKRFDNIRMSGYIQSQFQVAQREGTKSYSGGDFSQFSKSRFMLRRARVKIDYFLTTKDKYPKALFTFQFDATERGVNVRDMFLRFYETKHHNFALTTGLFARPFGYEVNLGSPDRESPERGRMSQLLMKTERDLGAMVSFEPRKKDHPLRYFKLDMGLFNGPGLTAPADYDSYKDFIARASFKPYQLGTHFILSAGCSYFNGGFLQNTKYTNRVVNAGGVKTFITDSSLSNIDTKAPRRYAGADIQLKYKREAGYTEIRAEYWQGTQTATAASTETPATLLTEPSFTRKFNGAFIYLLHNIFNTHHQLCIKYDWYDPNTSLSGSDIGKAGTSLNATDIKYSTLGFGYNYYVNDNLRLLLWYEIITNESTLLPAYNADVKDNLLTCRLQFRF